MPVKLNISEKGKAWKAEVADESLFGKVIGDKINGKEIKAELDGYELEITGGSDSSGFPLSKDIEGIGVKRVLLTKGWGMHDSRAGVRVRKTIRGKQVSPTTALLNLKVVKSGSKPLAEVFPDQNKAPEAAKPENAESAKPESSEPAA